MKILLNDNGVREELEKIPQQEILFYQSSYEESSIAWNKFIAKAQLKQVAHAIEAMTADGYWLEDIVKAILKEAEAV